MAYVNPSRYADERQAMHPQIPPHHDSESRKRRNRIRSLVRRVFRRADKTDQ